MRKSPAPAVTTVLLKTPCCPWCHQNFPGVCDAPSPEPWKYRHRLSRWPFRRGQVWQQHDQSSAHYKVIPSLSEDKNDHGCFLQNRFLDTNPDQLTQNSQGRGLVICIFTNLLDWWELGVPLYDYSIDIVFFSRCLYQLSPHPWPCPPPSTTELII